MADIDKILKRLKFQNLNELSKFSESGLKKRGKLTTNELATVYSALVMAGLRMVNESTDTKPPAASCAAICNYEVIQKRVLAVAGEIVRVNVNCSPGNRVLGGGYNLLIPVLPTYDNGGYTDTKPHLIVLHNGPGLLNYIDAQNPLRHYAATSWVVEIFFQDLPNFLGRDSIPPYEVWVYAIAAKAVEATSGAGYYNPNDPHAFDP